MEQSNLLRYALEKLETMNVTYAVVGSFASGAYGEPRFTQDIDIVVDLRDDHVAEFCESFPDPEFYVSQPAVQQAVVRRGQFNVIHPTSGNKIDFMLSGTDEWDRNQLARRRNVQILPDRCGYLASPEDVILGKMVYYREGGSEKHLRDIAGILRLRDDADHEYITQFVEQLGVTEVWQAVLKRLSGEE
ncbi:MAG: hypothetical protein CMJ64_05675 [Planctomycetaceae bacterium]|nr:hypothetical protein [Planctomycetaceae bacterium]